MARKTSTRKPAPRRRAPAKGRGKPKRSFAAFGWMAAAALGLGWMVSDGRPLTYANALLSPTPPPTRQAARSERAAAPERPQLRRETAQAPPPAVKPAPRPGAAERVRVAALPISTAATPRPAPRLGPLEMPGDSAPSVRAAKPISPKPAAPLPAAALQTAAPAVAARATPVTPAMAPAGSEHHATRRLPMRAAPEDKARILASIDSGTEVRVLRAEGPWRYVTSRSGEGWVDGTYLAGETSASPQTSIQRPAGPAREMMAVLAPFSPTRDRQAPERNAAPRTRLPPAAISSR